MESRSNFPKLLILPLLIAVSLLAGWIIPHYYDWTDSDQSRSSPLVWQTALGLIVAAIMIWAVLPWLPIADNVPRTAQSARIRFRFTTRTMLLLTAAVAFVIVAFTKFPLVASGVLCALAFCYLVWFWVRYRQYRWQTTALMACMWLPFVWVIAWDDLHYSSEILWLAAGMPALFPGLMIGSGLFGQNPHNAMWLAVLLTGAEMATGAWIIRVGPRRSIAYVVFVLLTSIFGSFVLHALMRA